MKRAQITRTNAPGGRVPPTFALLWEKRSLAVCNPENGARFTISLRDWEDIIWAVRVHPDPKWRHHVTPHTTAHRMMSRIAIENWLEGLRMTKGPSCASSARSSP